MGGGAPRDLLSVREKTWNHGTVSPAVRLRFAAVLPPFWRRAP